MPRTHLIPRIEAVLRRCEGVFADMTLKGYRLDLVTFYAWCTQNCATAYSAYSDMIASFITQETARLSPSTLKRRLAAIRFVHIYGDQAAPTKSSAVRLAMRRATMLKARLPKQAAGLYDVLLKILEACPPTLEGFRGLPSDTRGLSRCSAHLSWIGHTDTVIRAGRASS
jgi:integrase/recombinase XerD